MSARSSWAVRRPPMATRFGVSSNRTRGWWRRSSSRASRATVRVLTFGDESSGHEEGVGGRAVG